MDIKRLARLRQIRDEHKGRIAAIQAEIDALITERYGASLEHENSMLSTAEEEIAEVEAKLRKEAVDRFRFIGDKGHGPVRVKEYTVLAYDPGEAHAYCVRYLPATLKMDKRKFEKAAKVLDLGFVTIGTEPRATIARDLSGYLDAPADCQADAEQDKADAPHA